MGTSPATKVFAAAASILLVAAVYVWRLDRAAGLVVDDAYYVLLAQSLAQGGPYALVNSAAVPILPSVPPMFPAILSVVFRVSPSFPRNLILLKSVSIAAMIAAGFFTFWYGHRTRMLPAPVAWGVAIAVALTPGFVFLATSTIMAECVFTALQLATVLVGERAASVSDADRSRGAVAFAALLTVSAWLVRSAGVTLIAAALIHLLRRRRRPTAVMFVVVLAACAMPWLVYSQRHAPSAIAREQYGGSIAVAYGDAIRLRVAGTTSSGRVDWSELPVRMARNVLNIFGRDMGGLVAPLLYRPATESGEEVFSLGTLGFLAGSMGNASGTIIFSLMLSVVVLVGYIEAVKERVTVVEFLVPLTLAMVLIYPYWTYRFVLPLAPFILVYLVVGCRTMAASAFGGDVWRPARILVLTIVALNLVDHTQYIRLGRDPLSAASIDWLAESQALDDLFAWMDAHLTEPGGIASTNPALVYLRTGRKGVTFDGSTVKRDEWKALGIRYVAVFRPTDLPAPLSSARVVYRDARRRWWIVEI